ncbi:MAG: ankyrin repeat-containing domain protein, partial [Olpidium bornovanus]
MTAQRQLGLDSNAANDYGWTALCVASYHGHLSMARLLLAHPAVLRDGVEGKGVTPLLCAAQGGHEPIVRLLLDVGADPNARFGGPAPGAAAAAAGGTADAEGPALGPGAATATIKPTTVTTTPTPLMVVCLNQRPDIVALLLRHRASCNAQCRLNGWSALMYAVTGARTSVIREDAAASERGGPRAAEGGSAALGVARDILCMLLERGANARLRALDGRSALDLAESIERLRPLSDLMRDGRWVRQRPEDEAFNGRHDDIESQDERDALRRHRIFDAVNSNDAAGLHNVLLADPSSYRSIDPSDGSTPLILAASRGFIACVEVLVTHITSPLQLQREPSSAHQAGPQDAADSRILDARDESAGWTALMHAAYNGHPDVVRVLIDRGASVSVRSGGTGQGCTAAEII